MGGNKKETKYPGFTYRYKKDEPDKIKEYFAIQSNTVDTMRFLIEQDIFLHGIRDLSIEIPAVRTDAYFERLYGHKSRDTSNYSSPADTPTANTSSVYGDNEKTNKNDINTDQNPPLDSAKPSENNDATSTIQHTEDTKKVLIEDSKEPDTTILEENKINGVSLPENPIKSALLNEDFNKNDTLVEQKTPSDTEDKNEFDEFDPEKMRCYF